MESNLGEAIKNNISGTKTLADLCLALDYVDRFVMISTDKAVNPSSIMGATKRIAERYIQHLPSTSKTKFLTVRFGNVLGSAGSVIPIFKEQIKKGGPVTVTHPEMTRYFMTIPEATQLVLQAGAMGQGREIFVLDMGEPVKIVDLATTLIKLSGLKPGEDIKIEFSGIRPGEKLYEELNLDSERVSRTGHAKVFIFNCSDLSPEDFSAQIQELVAQADSASASDLKRLIAYLVPEYQGSEHLVSTAMKTGT
jgi:FlaA1/EpsC-like NDP-sugar epimerase